MAKSNLTGRNWSVHAVYIAYIAYRWPPEVVLYIGFIGFFQFTNANAVKSRKIVKIREFTLVIIFVIFPQKWQFRLKNENFEISRKNVSSMIISGQFHVDPETCHPWVKWVQNVILSQNNPGIFGIFFRYALAIVYSSKCLMLIWPLKSKFCFWKNVRKWPLGPLTFVSSMLTMMSEKFHTDLENLRP